MIQTTHLSPVKNYLAVIISCIGLSVQAVTFQRPNAVESSKISVFKQFYTTLGWHDGGRMASFFIPYKLQQGKTCVWVDTGIILQGAQMGYRHLLTPNHFVGVYFGYDVMTETMPMLSGVSISDMFSSPVRLNIGGELSHAKVGQLTLNGYGNVSKIDQCSKAKDYLGVSAKLAFHHFGVFNGIKPFVGAAHAWVGLPQNDWRAESLISGIVGAKCIVNRWIDCEFKYVYDAKGYQSPFQAGLQIKFDGVHPCHDYFRYKFIRPVDQYIPYYQSSVQLEGFKSSVREDIAPSNNIPIVRQQTNSDSREPSQSLQSNGASDMETLWLNQGVQIKYNKTPFSLKECQRADRLARLNGLNERKNASLNCLSTTVDNVQVDLIGGVSEKELRVLWTNASIPKQALLTVQDTDGNGLGVGILGSPASFLYGVQCLGTEVVEAALSAFAENIVLAKVVHKTPQGRTKMMFLTGSLTGIKAEHRAIRNQLLASA